MQSIQLILKAISPLPLLDTTYHKNVCSNIVHKRTLFWSFSVRFQGTFPPRTDDDGVLLVFPKLGRNVIKVKRRCATDGMYIIFWMNEGNLFWRSLPFVTFVGPLGGLVAWMGIAPFMAH